MSTVTFKVTDSAGHTASKSLAYTVSAPPTDGVLLGSSLAGNTGGRNVAPGMRVYLGVGATPSSVSGAVQEAIDRSTKFIWLSSKETPTSWLQDYMPELKAACDATGLLVVYTANHEPDGGSSVLAPATYHAGWDRARPICNANGIITASCLTSSKGDFQKDGPSLWDQYYRDDLDLNGFDRYNLGALSGSESWNDPADIVARIEDWYKSKNDKPFAIGETGSQPSFPRQAEWAKAMRDYVMANDYRFACWYDSRQTNLTAASAAAWLDGTV